MSHSGRAGYARAAVCNDRFRRGRADRFLARAEGLDHEGLQQLMARAIGNFKRGNER
jgi:hypothetical protein